LGRAFESSGGAALSRLPHRVTRALATPMWHMPCNAAGSLDIHPKEGDIDAE